MLLSCPCFSWSAAQGIKPGKRRAQVSSFLLQAIKARPELNPQLFEEGKYTFIVTADGKKKYLSNTMERERFALQCRCNNWHVRYATLHSISDEADLYCQWDEYEEDSGVSSDRNPVSEDEKAAMEAVQSAGLDHTTACQVKLSFWHGLLDFYHIPSKTAMQADGSSHFKLLHHRAPSVQLLKDIECCSKAWSEGVRLLRVHHEYGACQDAMVLATQLPYTKFVMLAGCYKDVVIWYKGQHISYVELLAKQLDGARCERPAVAGCLIFC